VKIFMSRVKLTDTVFRDAHQSLLATRMRTRDMLPIAEKMDQVGFFSLETWGGATFDTCIRYLNEDPWERLRALKKAMPNTPMQMLLRGQNLGYLHQVPERRSLGEAQGIKEGHAEHSHANAASRAESGGIQALCR